MRFIFPLIFILISIGAFIFGVNPLYKDVSSLRSEITIYNSALDNSTILQKTEDALVAQYNSIKQIDKERLDNFLPSSVNNIQFILELERIGSLRNMPIKDIKFENIKKEVKTGEAKVIVSAVKEEVKPYGVFPVKFTTEGNYDTFILFLKDLEYNLRLMNVKSISFDSPVPTKDGKITDGKDPNVYSYNVEVETYWLK